MRSTLTMIWWIREGKKTRGTVGIQDERVVVELRVGRRGEKTSLIQTSHRCCVTHLTTTAIHPGIVDLVLCLPSLLLIRILASPSSPPNTGYQRSQYRRYPALRWVRSHCSWQRGRRHGVSESSPRHPKAVLRVVQKEVRHLAKKYVTLTRKVSGFIVRDS